MSKKRIGIYRGKPIITGDENVFTSNEIYSKEQDGKLSLKKREGNSTKDICGGSGGNDIVYFVADKDALSSSEKELTDAITSVYAKYNLSSDWVEQTQYFFLYNVFALTVTQAGSTPAVASVSYSIAIQNALHLYGFVVPQCLYYISALSTVNIESNISFLYAEIFRNMPSFRECTKEEYEAKYENLVKQYT